MSEICEAANVHRATFYKHFNDKYEFLNFCFDNELSKIVPTLEWSGCRIPLSNSLWEPTVPLSKFVMSSKITGWARCVLERLGLPMYFSNSDGGAVFLDGRRDEFFSDEEIEKIL